MPESEVRRLHRDGMNSIMMAPYFGVSISAANVRMSKLGLR